jgi:serine/threonine protein phosphatase PrpC
MLKQGSSYAIEVASLIAQPKNYRHTVLLTSSVCLSHRRNVTTTDRIGRIEWSSTISSAGSIPLWMGRKRLVTTLSAKQWFMPTTSTKCRQISSSSSTSGRNTDESAGYTRMRLWRNAQGGLLIATTAAFALHKWIHDEPTVLVCRAERYSFFSSSKKEVNASTSVSDKSNVANTERPTTTARNPLTQVCPNDSDDDDNEDDFPFYGCPLKPIDVHYNTDALKQALAVMRNDKRVVVAQHATAAPLLASCANDQHVTLTLIGYKGGELISQINQDRAVIVAPYSIRLPSSSQSHRRRRRKASSPFLIELDDDLNTELSEFSSNMATGSSPAVESFLAMDRTLLGVFDGHAPLGEHVSEHTATELPKLLANKLSSKAKQAVDEDTSNSKVLSDRDVMQLTKAALIESFIELDRTAPANPSGGCTASVVLWQDSKIYIANAGDSRSFIVAYRPSTNNVTVTYISREDKPSLPDERARIEAYGGQVYIPARGTSRVVYHDSTTGAPTGLAMSRSIGDWEAGQMGVIPDPIVDIIDVPSMIARILLEDDGDATDPDAYQVDPVGHILDPAEYLSSGDHHLVGGDNDDVYLFAVSATDGMMDYLQETQIARVLAHSLFHEAGAHPIAAVEHLIFAAANAWQDAKQGRYRDDIAIAVSALRRPPRRDERNGAPAPRPTKAAQ